MLKRAAADRGVMGTLVGAGVGGASYFATAKLAPKVPFLVGRWWAAPTALLILGHLAKRYSQETGQAVVGAAGSLMAFSYYVNAQTPAPAAQPAAASGIAPMQTGEAGAVARGGYGIAGALQEYRPSRTSAFRSRSAAGALVT